VHPCPDEPIPSIVSYGATINKSLSWLSTACSVSLLGDGKTPHSRALSVFRSGDAAHSRLHDTTLYSASHCSLFESLSSVFSASPQRLRRIRHDLAANEYMNLSHMSPKRPVRQFPPILHVRSKQDKRAAREFVDRRTSNLWALHMPYDHELLHVKLKSSSSPAPDFRRFRIPSLIDLATSSTVFPRFLLPVFSRPSSVPLATNW
jgi:hypothetical protein